jgi:hypothetical protein
LQDIKVFQGVTWIPSHGEVVGFVSTPMPKSWRTRWLASHFRMLMWVFAPAARIRERNAEPRLYWLTRDALARNISKLKPSAREAMPNEHAPSSSDFVTSSPRHSVT